MSPVPPFGLPIVTLGTLLLGLVLATLAARNARRAVLAKTDEIRAAEIGACVGTSLLAIALFIMAGTLTGS